MAQQTSWTPASQPGLIPLYPMSFGQVFGRTFAALRHNPKVLLAFAVCVQALVSAASSLLILYVGMPLMFRLETINVNTEDGQAVAAGTTVLFFLMAIAAGLVSQCLAVIIQGIVAVDVAAGAVAEKITLGEAFRRLKPSILRLIGYTLLFSAAVTVAVAIVVGVVILLMATAGNTGIVLGVIIILLGAAAAVAATIWLGTKLLLVPSTIVLERVGIFAAIRRSWTLTRGRFWPIFGISVLISLAFSAIGSVIGSVFQLAGSFIASSVMPNGSEASIEQVLTLVTAQAPGTIVQLVVSAVGSVVTATAATILYIDARMRKEGLDIDLLTYVERRDAGEPTVADPYAYDPATVHRPAPVPGAYAPQQAGYPYAQGFPQQQGYPQQRPYAGQPYPQQQAYPQQQPYQQQPYPQQSYPQQGYPQQQQYPGQTYPGPASPQQPQSYPGQGYPQQQPASPPPAAPQPPAGTGPGPASPQQPQSYPGQGYPQQQPASPPPAAPQPPAGTGPYTPPSGGTA
ncbi:glycerophosphoryl diester phosphodiesterase membrane domain-containing protein [Microbacterium gorillae]|uniref:glycerophosphoryl diester phosphodiesterase membrane domain-containing protein n=1 Tax=Microbacterium gorillae TaxID=1231063 RepID=UPI0006937D5F|nr:glycerophosphoryl diester phosphodiesterase membrane domain-containing protein [Microbacterium gorillae]